MTVRSTGHASAMQDVDLRLTISGFEWHPRLKEDYPMHVLLTLVGLLSLAAGGAILGAAQSAIHEIEAFLLFIISAICISGAAVTQAVNRVRAQSMSAPSGPSVTSILACLVVASTCATPALADDVSSTMAALKDEKAECRYLLQLCEESVRADRIQAEKKVAAEAAVKRAQEANSGAFQFGSAGKDAKREAQRAINWWEAAINVAGQKRAEVATAAKMIKVKRDKMPACVERCVGPAGEKLIAPW